MARMLFFVYCKSVCRHWWPLLSCALFTGLGLYILYANKSNAWAVKATFALAGVCLLIACFQTWRDEHLRYESSTAEVAQLQQKYHDGRPRIALTVRSPKNAEEWQTLNNVRPPPIFRLEHYAGRAARFVRINPVVSSLGLFTMRFDEAAILAENGRQVCPVTFTIYQNNASDLSHDPRILQIQQSAEMLVHFFRDHPADESEGRYEVGIRYRDEDSSTEYGESFVLSCQYPRLQISVEPKSPM